MTGIIILAAGSSSRLSKPKQNLVYKGRTLLQRAIETALKSVCRPVIVVLGANENVIMSTIEGFDAAIIQNPGWQEGMASSIRSGIEELQIIEPEADSVILMLCDQPFVDASLIDRLVQKKSIKSIVACAYDNTIGAPVLFAAAYFDELLLLKGQEGAKKLLMKYPYDVITVSFPRGSIDIDTVEDFERL
ncbi:MAG TPA: nucleotidyltransferase family protein [Mucilaginibacter sp.]|jgi:molybdenum cofactor cytidylyltransferase